MIGAAIGLGIGAISSIAGLFGSGKARREMEAMERGRPIYSRPDEIKSYLEMAKTGANEEMPGTTQLKQNIERATQGGIRNIQNLTESPTASLGAINELYQSEVGAYNNLAMQQAQFHEAKQKELQRALQESAKYSDLEFEYNVNSPWQRGYQNAINRYQSNRNLFQSGLGIMANSASQFGGLPSKGTGGSSSGGSLSLAGVNPFAGSVINYNQAPLFTSPYSPMNVDPNIGNGIDQSLLDNSFSGGF